MNPDGPSERVFPLHRGWAKTFGCAVPNCAAWPVDFAHLRTAANAGTGLKPHDAFGTGFCRNHHREEHNKGDAHMAAKYGVNRWRIAADLVRRSPDDAMRDSFMQLPAHLQDLLWAA